MQNPFVIGLLAEGAHFADREREVERIARAFRDPGGKLVVYGDRRLGKSSAMERAAREVRGGGGKVAIASFATASDPSEAAQRVLAAVQKEVGPSWREIFDRIAEHLNTSFEIKPSATPGALPSVRFGFNLRHPDVATRLLPDVLDALDTQMERRGIVLGIGLDEFQRIHEWGGEDVEWALRDPMLRHRCIAYVLAGSKRGLIEAMIGNKGRALWKLGDVLAFGPIDDEVLGTWIVEQSESSGVGIPAESAQQIVRLARPRTRDVVQLARAVWFIAVALGRATSDGVLRAMEQVVGEQAELYRAIWAKLDPRAQSVLRAFAAGDRVQITATETMERYRLGPKSSVQSTVERLLGAEHLTRIEQGGYAFDDPFFRRWVQVYGLPDIGEAVPPLDSEGV